MSLYLNAETKVLIQGITGNMATYHGKRMLASGTNILAGVNPGRGGDWALDGKVPVFDTVRAAVEMTGVNTSVIFVPVQNAVGAIYEAVDAGIELVICVTKGIPINDMLKVLAYLKKTNTRLIGPGAAGINSLDFCNVGVIANMGLLCGNVGIVSSSEGLIYETMDELKKFDIGISSVVELGSGPIFGTSFEEVLLSYEADGDTDFILMLGEVGVIDEEFSEQFATSAISKPVFSYLSEGFSTEPDYGGYAGMILNGSRSSYEQVVAEWQLAGFYPYSSISDMVDALRLHL